MLEKGEVFYKEFAIEGRGGREYRYFLIKILLSD